MKYSKYLLPLTTYSLVKIREKTENNYDNITFFHKICIVLSLFADIFLWLCILFVFLVFVLPISFIIVLLFIIVVFVIIFIIAVLIFILCFAFVLLNIFTLGTPIYIIIFCFACFSVLIGIVAVIKETR